MRVPQRFRQSGFTLIELMVTLAVLAILLVAAAPSFADFFERYRLRSAVDDTLDLFLAARQGAVEADRNVNVTFGPSDTAWCVGAVQQAEPATYQPVSVTPGSCGCNPVQCKVNEDVLVVDGTGRPGVTLASGVNTTFTYDSKAGALIPLASHSVDFLSSSQRYGLRVTISPLGQARACSIVGKRPIPGYKSC